VSDEKVTRIGRGAGGRLQNADGTWNGGRKARGEKLRQLENEVKELRARLALSEPVEVESWERVIPEEMRDQFAAMALMREWGSTANALARMGFDVGRGEGQIWGTALDALAARVFEKPGVTAILSHNFADVEASWQEILQRQRKIALYGDDDASARAAAQLAKIEGRVKPEAGPTVNVSLFGLFGNSKPDAQAITYEHAREAGDPLAILSHEPGPARRIDSGDEHVTAAIGSEDDE